MKFAEPLWLLAGLATLAFLFALFRRFDSRQRAALADFASSHLLNKLTASFSPGRRRLKRLLFAVGVGLIFIALGRPQLGFHWEEEHQRGIDILFAIDTSKSMLTQDVNPDRLTRAKLGITDFVNQLNGDRVGLIAFAGDAFLEAPLSLDYDAFGETLDAIDTSTIPRGGTDIASAIREAQAAFGNNTKNKKILVLVTDGEDLEGQGIDAARAAAQDGMVIYTVGVGTPAGGLIPVPGSSGGTDFIKDSSGQFVKSHLDESTLQQIAQVTGGLYEPLGQQGEGLMKIYNEALASLPKQDLSSRRSRVYEERFQWPLAAGILLLLASTLIGTRRRSANWKAAPLPVKKTFAALIALAAAASISCAQASPQSAQQAYLHGDYSTAEQQFEQAATDHPDAAPLQFDLGASAYKTGSYDKALPAFQKALDTDQVGVQQQAYYNIGNTQYRVGQKTEKSSPQDTIKAWQAAVQSYDDALKLQPDDADARYNRDFVEKKLEQLQKQNPQQQKQDQNQNQKNQQQNQDQNQQNQQQQQQQQQSGSQQQNQNQANNQSGQQKNQQGSQANNQQGSQPQNQNQASGQQQNQNGQPQNQQGNQQQTAGNQGNQNQQGGQNQPQQGANGDKNPQLAQGNKPAGATVPDKNQPSQQPNGQAGVARQGNPDELTPEEARELLDSMKNNEHALPATVDARNNSTHSPDEPVLKDW